MKNHMRVVWASFALLVAAFIGLPTAFAQTTEESEVFRAEGKNGHPAALRIFQSPCEDAQVLAHLIRRGAAEMVQGFKKAVLTWDGKDWSSCWIEVDGIVFSLDEENSPFQPVPRAMFKDDSV